MKAVILAGGKGTRLTPYTTNFPKPLMPLGEKPILEIVINKLNASGFDDIIITTGHLGELIRVFFQNGEKFGVKITYSREDQPLGTAGPLNLIKEQITDTFLLMNGDVLCDINFAEFLKYHKAQKGLATIALSKREVNIDFGIVNISQDNLFHEWKEKPTIDYLVSTGIYLFEKEALKYLPSDNFCNLPDFIINLQKEKMKIVTHIHKGYWLDIGRPEDYAKACKDYSEIF